MRKLKPSIKKAIASGIIVTSALVGTNAIVNAANNERNITSKSNEILLQLDVENVDSDTLKVYLSNVDKKAEIDYDNDAEKEAIEEKSGIRDIPKAVQLSIKLDGNVELKKDNSSIRMPESIQKVFKENGIKANYIYNDANDTIDVFITSETSLPKVESCKMEILEVDLKPSYDTATSATCNISPSDSVEYKYVSIDNVEYSSKLSDISFKNNNYTIVPNANDDTSGGTTTDDTVKPPVDNTTDDTIDPPYIPPVITDIDNHWAKSYIQEFLDKGYVNGYGDGTFRPDNSITRAEFIKIVNKVFGFNQKSQDNFKDVSKDKWYYDEVSIAKEAGYINGYEDGTFRPNDEITREEMAKIIATIKGAKGDGKINFKDSDKISNWAKPYVDALEDMSVLQGYGNDEFGPKNDTTRAETVKVMKFSK